MSFTDILKATAIIVLGFILFAIGAMIIPLMIGLGGIWIVALMIGMKDEEEDSSK